MNFSILLVFERIKTSRPLELFRPQMKAKVYRRKTIFEFDTAGIASPMCKLFFLKHFIPVSNSSGHCLPSTEHKASKNCMLLTSTDHTANLS
jgi:hypothetical protein